MVFGRRWFLKSVAAVPLAIGHIQINLTKESEAPLQIPKRNLDVKLLEPGWYNVRIADIKLSESQKDGSPLIKMVLEELSTGAIIFQHLKPEQGTIILAHLQRFEPIKNLIIQDSIDLDEFRDKVGRVWIDVEVYDKRKFQTIKVLKKDK